MESQHVASGGLARLLAASSGATELASLKSMGLGINQAELEQLAQSRREALAQSGRIEFGQPALLAVADAFAASPYLEREQCADQLEALQAVFYSARADAPSSIPDDELIDGMRAAFDGCCGGDLDALAALSAQELLSLASTPRTRARRPLLHHRRRGPHLHLGPRCMARRHLRPRLARREVGR